MEFYKKTVALKVLFCVVSLTLSACSNGNDSIKGASTSSGQAVSEGQDENHSQHKMSSGEMNQTESPLVENGSGDHSTGMHSAEPGKGTDEKDRHGMNHANASKNMQGINHNEDNQGQHAMDNMQNKRSAEPKESKEMDMAGMNHQTHEMNSASKQKKASIKEMNHSQPNLQNSTMSGMDHQNMQRQDSIQAASGMNHSSGTTQNVDMNGRPLIDATKPYDNNPAWEQKKDKQKQ